MNRLREMGRPDLFKPWLVGSQACEEYFRLTRACTSTGSTMVNFTLLEFLHRSRKVDASFRLTAQGVQDGIKYPRFKQPFENAGQQPEDIRNSKSN